MGNKAEIFERRMININGDLRERVVYQRHMADDFFGLASGVYSEALGIIDERLDVIASGILAEDFVLAGPVKNVSNPHFIYSLDSSIFPDASGTREIGTPAVTWDSGAFNELYVPEITSDVIVHGNVSVEGTITQYNYDEYDVIELNVSGDTKLGDGTDDVIDLVGTIISSSGNVLIDDNLEVNGKVDALEITNSYGDLKIQPDASGNVILFGDTDIVDISDGKKLIISRRAVEGDQTLEVYIDQYNNAIIEPEIAGDLVLDCYYTGSNIRLDKNSVIGKYQGGNKTLQHYGYITADTSDKYVQWQINDATDYFELTREDVNVLGLDVQMPLVTDEIDVSGDMSVDGNVVFNDDSNDRDFRVETDGNASMLFVDGGNNLVIIGNDTPMESSSLLEVVAEDVNVPFRIGAFTTANMECGRTYYHKSHHGDLGTLAETVDGDYLGAAVCYGVDSGVGWAGGAWWRVIQRGAAGANYVGADWVFTTFSSTGENTDQFILVNDGTIAPGGSIIPNASGTLDVGSISYAFDEAYIDKLYLEADPTTPLMAATKQYVDNNGGSGSATFIGLTDTPADYIGMAASGVRVNAGADALEFFDISNWDSSGYSVVQVVNVQDGAYQKFTTPTPIPRDDTIPENTEGSELMTLAITPSDAGNILIIEAVAQIAHSNSNSEAMLALFQDSDQYASAVSESDWASVDNNIEVVLRYYMVAGTTSETTLKIRGGSRENGDLYFNGRSSARLFGGVFASSITITELDPSGGGSGSSGASGERLDNDISQAGHSFVVGDLLRWDTVAGDYTKALADAEANAEVIGVVSEVAGSNDFTLAYGGYLEGLSGLTAGTVYYLSEVTEGLLTSTEPTSSGTISKPVFIAVSTTSGYFFNMRGVTVVGGGTSDSTGMSLDINEATHGFSVGDVLRYTGLVYTEAQADSEDNAEVVGIVTSVTDVDNFTLTYGGKISSLSGMTPGDVYYLSDATAGLLTSTEPANSGSVSKPLLIAVSATTGYFFNMRGNIIAGGGGGSTGKVVQIVNTIDGTVNTGSTVVPEDDTPPLITEGNEYMSLAITPTSSYNYLKIDVLLNLSVSANVNYVIALFNTDFHLTEALAVSNIWLGAGYLSVIPLTYYVEAGTTNSTTFRVRAGGNSGPTTTFNGLSTNPKYDGRLASSITITEISA